MRSKCLGGLRGVRPEKVKFGFLEMKGPKGTLGTYDL